VYADDGYEPLARVESQGSYSVTHYYHNDVNGLPERLTDSDGDTVWSATFQIWGTTFQEVRDLGYGVHQNLRFQGQYLDRETGLHYNTFRYYDPDIGRFTTPDPIGLSGGINLYQYAPNPVGWIDPWGWSCTRIRHYTSLQGLKGIQDSGVIKARDNNRVYGELAKNKPMSPVKVGDTYQINQQKTKHYVETDVLDDRIEWIKNPRYGNRELTVYGDLELKNPTFIKRK